jgi:hypothetical protein
MYFNNEESDKTKLLEEMEENKENAETSRPETFDIERSHANSHDRPLPVPKFILDQMTIFEKSKCYRIFCCCFSRCYEKYKIYKIKNRELGVYYGLKNIAIQSYDESNKFHEDSLKILYSICIKTEYSADLKTNDWKNIGFQVSNIFSI